MDTKAYGTSENAMNAGLTASRPDRVLCNALSVVWGLNNSAHGRKHVPTRFRPAVAVLLEYHRSQNGFGNTNGLKIEVKLHPVGPCFGMFQGAMWCATLIDHHVPPTEYELPPA